MKISGLSSRWKAWRAARAITIISHAITRTCPLRHRKEVCNWAIEVCRLQIDLIQQAEFEAAKIDFAASRAEARKLATWKED